MTDPITTNPDEERILRKYVTDPVHESCPDHWTDCNANRQSAKHAWAEVDALRTRLAAAEAAHTEANDALVFERFMHDAEHHRADAAASALLRALRLLANTATFDQGATGEWHRERSEVVGLIDRLRALPTGSNLPPAGNECKVTT